MTRKRIRPSQAGTKISNVQPFSVREFFVEFPNDEVPNADYGSSPWASSHMRQMR